MEISLRLLSPESSDERIDAMARELAVDLNRETTVQARQEYSAASSGTRGDPVAIGTLALTFVTSGAAVAMLKVIESWFNRNSALKVELRRPDGKVLVFEASNLRPGAIQPALKLAQAFFED